MRKLNILWITVTIYVIFNGIIGCAQVGRENIQDKNLLSFHGIPRPDSFVSDHDRILSQSQYDSLNVASIELLRGADVSLINLIVKNSGVENFKREFADSIFNIWGIGDSITNRGLLIAISIEDRNIAIVTGLGLEEECPDSLCESIIREMIPYCKKDMYYNALSVGTKEIKNIFL